MRNKIFTGLLSCFLLLTFFSVVTSVNAQPRNQNKSKPNGKAKKLVDQGNQSFGQKDFRTAINKYAEAIVISPNYAEAHFWKGYAHYNLTEYDAALEELNSAADQGYTPIKIYQIRWDVNFQNKNYDAALNDLQKGLQIQPDDAQFTLGIAKVYRLQGAYQNAIDNYKKYLVTDPNSGDVFYYMSVCHFNLGDVAQQGLSAVEAVKKNTFFVGESYLLMGDAFQKSKKPSEAIQAYERALNVKPDLPDVYATLSDLYRSQSRLSEAIATARKGIKLYPNDGNLFVSLTWYYSLADRHNEAVTAGQQAVKFAPEQAMAYTNLCRAYNDTKQYPQAIAACNNALKLNPNDGETNFYLARAYDLQEKYDAATPYYKKAVIGLIETTRTNPDYSDGYYLLGNAYFAEKQIDKAIEAYKTCLRLSPKFSKAIYNLGVAYFRNKEKDAAIEQYNTLLKIDTALAGKLKQTMDNK